MERRLRQLLGLLLVLAYLPILAYAQQVPVSANLRQRVDDLIDGKVVSSLVTERIFYRAVDGSTLAVVTPKGQQSPNSGTLWDNRTGISYRLDLKQHIASEDPHSPHVPNRPQSVEYYRSFPTDSVEGIRCNVVPLWMHSADGSLANPGNPGRSCVSAELGLELRSDVAFQSGPGRTKHLVSEFFNIKVNPELDPALFDVRRYTIEGPKH